MPIHVMHLVRPASGGIREHVRQLAFGMPRGKIRMTVVCPEDSPLLHELPNWIETRTLPLQDGVHPAADIRTIIKFRKLLSDSKVDVLHMHGAKAALIGRAAAVSLRGRLRGHETPKWAGAGRSPVLVYTCHNFIEPENTLLRHAFSFAESKLAAQTDLYIAVSEALNSRLQQQFSLRSDKVVTIYNGISDGVSEGAGDLSRDEIRQLLGVPPNAKVIGTIARLTPEKGVSDLLHAFRLLRESGLDPWLVIIGDGPQKLSLQAEYHDVSHRTRWLGTVESAARLLKGLDLYVQSSRREGFGLAVLEAMRAGAAVVATRCGGLPELIGSEGVSWLVPAGNPHALADKIRQMLTDQAARLRWALQGQQRALANFSAERMIMQTLQVYDRVLGDTIGGMYQ